VKNVPSFGNDKEFLQLCATYGTIEEYRVLYDYETEEYTDVYWVKYLHITCAQEAKRKLDNYPFLGKLLDVSYAPQFENISDTREKLAERRKAVLERTQPGYYDQQQQQASAKIYPPSKIDQKDVDPLLLPFSVPSYQHEPTPLKDLTPVYPVNKSITNKQPTQISPPVQLQFSDASMNKTVLTIREKLKKVSAIDSSQAKQISKRRRI